MVPTSVLELIFEYLIQGYVGVCMSENQTPVTSIYRRGKHTFFVAAQFRSRKTQTTTTTTTKNGCPSK
jgi:hypothetical protein